MSTGSLIAKHSAVRFRFSLPWVSVCSLLTVAALWELIGRAAELRVLPPLSTVAQSWTAFYADGSLMSALAESAKTFGLGVGLATGAAIALTLLMSVSPTLEYVMEPYIDAGMSIPITATIPILMMAFGLGQTTRVAVVFLYAFFIMVVNMQAGLRKIDPLHSQLAAAYGASNAQIIRKITIPSAIPMAVTGMRLGLSRGMRGMVNAEVIISTAGIGWLLMRSSREFDIAGVYAITGTIVIASVTLMGVLSLLERAVLRNPA